MKRKLITTLALALPLVLMSCADESVPTAPASHSELSIDEHVDAGDYPSYHSVLGARSLSTTLGKRNRGTGTFATPLFGLATAPNDDILVADAGAGVATKNGFTDIALPGVTAVSPIGRGSMWATTAGTDVLDDTGQALYRVSKGKSHLIVNLFQIEAALNPDGNDPFDSNPYDVASLGGNAALVIDAGGNVLYRIDNQGGVEVLAVFPDEVVSTANAMDLADCPDSGAPLCGLPPAIPAQAVPTSVAIGPDGFYYVGELKGFPAPTGVSNIWRVAPDASWADCGSSPDCVKVFDGGFTSIIDLAFGADGTLYVAELDEKSWFAVEFGVGGEGGTINACDLSTTTCSEVAGGIPMLTAITLEKDGTLWATKNALIPGSGEVIQIP